MCVVPPISVGHIRKCKPSSTNPTELRFQKNLRKVGICCRPALMEEAPKQESCSCAVGPLNCGSKVLPRHQTSSGMLQSDVDNHAQVVKVTAKSSFGRLNDR